MDMGIVNAGQLAVYDEIAADLRERVEDVILNRRPDATERLLELAAEFKGQAKAELADDLSWRELPVEKRLDARAGQRHRRLRRRRHRGGAPAGRHGRSR